MTSERKCECPVTASKGKSCSAWQAGGFAPISKAWTERAYGLGEPCEVRLADRTFHGRAEALEADGALRVRLADGGVERVTAGDVFFGGT